MNAKPLRYPEADATAIAEVLRASGYKVTLLLGQEANQAAVQRELTKMQKQGTKDGVLLLGFFGHGVQYGELAYFCPFDTTLRAVRDKENNILRDSKNRLPLQEHDPQSLVSMRDMIDSLALSPAGSKLLLADCCREDPNAARGVLTSRGAFGSSLRVEELPKNCAALFACSDGEQAFEHDDWKHGAFTKALLTALNSGQRLTANGLSESLYVGVEELVSSKGHRQRVNSLINGGPIDLKLKLSASVASDTSKTKPPQNPDSAGKVKMSGKYALMIAVTRYDHAAMNGDRPLKFPEDDARALGKLFAEHGYVVDYLLGTEATREAILKALDGLAAKGNADGVCVVGLFGHGVEVEFLNAELEKKEVLGCFCPFDTSVRQAINPDGQKEFENGQPRIEPTPDSLVKMSEVVGALKVAKAGSRLLVADCCRVMPNRPRGRNLGLGANFSTERLPSQTAMRFGCRPGEEALESDEWKHGAFTKSLIEVLTQMSSGTEPVTTGTLADKVKRRVQQLTSNKQNPAPVSIDSIDLLLEKTDPTSFVNSVGATMVLIPAGSFMMGSPDSDSDAPSNERPQHRVTISRSYYMGETEVTQGQWKSVMGTEPWKQDLSVPEGAQCPAMYVSWDEAVKFCEKLSEREGKKYRLPTEAEWEYACRGGTSTRYSFGDNESNLSRFAWFDENALYIGEQYAHLVKHKQPNGFGLYDMHGNAREWCSDWYREYPSSTGINPNGSTDGLIHVTRGGSFFDSSDSCRSARRFELGIDDGSRLRYIHQGFRVAVAR